MPKIITLQQDVDKKRARQRVYSTENSRFLYEVLAFPVRHTIIGEKKTIIANAFFPNRRSIPNFFRMELDYPEHASDRRANRKEEERFREAQQHYEDIQSKREGLAGKV